MCEVRKFLFFFQLECGGRLLGWLHFITSVIAFASSAVFAMFVLAKCKRFNFRLKLINLKDLI
jgi:hypothetical protein